MLEIRAAQPADGDMLRALDPLAAPGTDRHRDIGNWVERGDSHLAQRDGDVAGFLVMATFLQRPFIELIVVGETHRRRGIASAPVGYARDLAPRTVDFRQSLQHADAGAPQQAGLRSERARRQPRSRRPRAAFCPSPTRDDTCRFRC
jgi:hypothetical protein